MGKVGNEKVRDDRLVFR